jgi:hypothetical protein
MAAGSEWSPVVTFPSGEEILPGSRGKGTSQG